MRLLSIPRGISHRVFVIFAYVITLALASGSIYVIYEEFNLLLSGASGSSSQYTDQIVALFSSFFILILLTSIFLIYLVAKSGDNHHSQILTLNHLLFFYGLITVIPLASIEDDSGNLAELIEVPLACSVITILVSICVVFYYTIHGSASYLNKHPITKDQSYQTMT